MAGTITVPVWGRKKVAVGIVFAAANALTGAAVGAALGLAGRMLPQSVIVAALGIVSACYLAYFIGRGRVPFMPWPPQLPPTWRDHERPLWTALRYGSVFGLAFSTPIRSGSLVALALLVGISGSPSLGATLFAVVGLLKSMPTATEPFRASLEDRRDNLMLSYTWQRPLVTIADAVLLAVVLGTVLNHSVV